MRHALFVLFFSAGFFSSSFSQDSAVLYYLHPYGISRSAIDITDIQWHADPYTTKNIQLINGLMHVLEDSMTKTYIGKFTKKTVYDLRILVRVYKKGKLIKLCGVNDRGMKAIIDRKMYVIENVSSLLRFIKHNFIPVTDRQKNGFVFPYKL